MKEKQSGKILIILLFIFLGLAALTFWYFQRNTYSKDVLKFEILGPEEARAGERVEYTVRYKNTGEARLEEVELVFEYPEKVLPLEREKDRVIKEIDDIYPGQEETIVFKAKVFGQEGELVKPRATLNYRPKNLKAFYESETTVSTKISEVPLTFVFDFPSKMAVDRESKLSLNYYSNFEEPISDLAINVNYPSEFEFQKTRPQGIEKDEWQIGVLNKGEGGKIEIYGSFIGGLGGEKVFEGEIGVWVQDNFVVLKSIRRGVQITKPGIVVTHEVNGSSDYVASPGDLLHYEIYFRNIGNDYLEDLYLVSELEGPFDFDTLKVPSGRVSDSVNTLFWDERDSSDLRFLAPGEEGKVDFWVSLKKEWDSSQYKQPVLKNDVSLGQVNEHFETKVNSRLVLEQKGYYENEVFEASGPIPPEVGKRTTYTIIWTVKNSFNRVENVRVKAILPDEVSLTDNVFPEDEKSNFAFDSSSRELLWKVGDLEPGVGFNGDALSLAFQVELKPTESQKGLVVPLVSEARLLGEDQWTEKELEISVEGVDSSLPDDDSVSAEEGVVQDGS